MIKLTSLNDFSIKVQLELGPFQNVLFNRINRDQAENAHFLGLTDTMGAVLSLQVLMRIPVAVENDDRVSRLQIETQTTGSGAEHEDEVRGIGFIEFLQQIRAVFGLG